MPGKHLEWFFRHSPTKQKRRAAIRAAALLCLSIAPAAIFPARVFAEDASQNVPHPKFLGSQTCSSSSCHGGAGDKSDQYTIWSTHDFHHARPYATLETARSERLAEVLKIGNPAQSARCTVCHAPFATVPPDRLGTNVQVTDGVSCESCHGPAENWIRSHTRLDYTHSDRVETGMRDLNNLYVRANTCVACHQNLDPEIRAAGHPELIFEMDGQCVTMPRHWPKAEDKPGPQAWLVGQLVAAREMFRPQQELRSESEVERDSAVLAVTGPAIDALDIRPQPVPELTDPWKDSDSFAKKVSEMTWTEAQTRACLKAIVDSSLARTNNARIAERLVLALDRLTTGMDATRTNAAVNDSLNRLFADAQSLPDFDPKRFATDLNTFHSSVARFLEKK